MTIQEMRDSKMRQALDYYDTIADASRALGCSQRTLYRFIFNELIKEDNE